MQPLRENPVPGLGLVIYTDGGARPNPGPAAFGVHIEDEAGNVLQKLSVPMGRGTNNQAEYRGMIAALQQAAELGAARVKILSDSLLLIEQIRGSYKVKDSKLQELHRQVKVLMSALPDVKIQKVPDSLNKAHALVQQALNGR